jgi:hypothetical protein
MKRWFIAAGILLLLIDACVSAGVKKPKPKPTKITVRYYEVAGDSALRHDSCLSEMNRGFIRGI